MVINMGMEDRQVENVKTDTGSKNAGAEIMELSAVCYMLGIVVLLPLYCKDGFVMLGDAKAEMFFRISAVTAAVFAIGFLLWSIDKIRHLHRGIIMPELSLTDKFMLLYGAAVIVAFCLSPYRPYSVFGAADWFMGFTTQLIMVWSYFLISRNFNFNRWILILLCSVSGMIFLLAILNKFAVDVFGMYDILDYWNKYHLIATFGNMNWYCGYCCVIFPLGMYFFWYFIDIRCRFFAGIYTVLSFATIITQGSDSGYLALGAVLAVFGFLSFKNNTRMKNFLQMLFLLPLSCLLLYVFYQLRGGINWLAKDSASEKIIVGNMWVWGLFVCIFLNILFYFMVKKVGIQVKNYRKARNYITLFLSAGALLLLAMVAVHALDPFAFTFLNNIPYLNFNDSWGTERGFLWKIVIKAYYEMPFLRKLFGAGPDCFAPYMYEHYGEVLEGYLWNRWGNAAVSNAHNEWLNSLITVGLAGTIGYMGSMLGGVLRLYKVKERAPYAFGFAFCILAYMCNQTVSFQQVLAAPFFFVMLGISESAARCNLKV